jgi:thioredoxin 1
MSGESKCLLLKDAKDLNEALRDNPKLFVLFYASWCPYSQRFLPDFIECSNTIDKTHVRILVDDNDDLVEKYSIDVYPTVLYFENGKVVERLDGTPHRGLNAGQYKDFIEVCVKK